MVDVATLRNEMEEAKPLIEDLGVVTRDLTETELFRFGRSFERQFVAGSAFVDLANIHLRHRKEALIGAMVAKEQMDANIDGEHPAPNKIGGPLTIRASFLGIGDDWEDIQGIYAGAQNSWSTGSPQNWIHSGTSLMGGSDGNAVRIGENLVLVIYGLGSLHASPKIESTKFTVNGDQHPTLLTGWAQRVASENNKRIKEIDDVYLLRKDMTVKAEVFISEAFGATSANQQDFPFPFGVAYVREDALRLQDPTNLPGTRYNVIHTT